MGDITELGKLFSSTNGGQIDTGDFLTRLANILATDEDAKLGGNHFNVFVCENNGRFLGVRGKYSFDQEHIVDWLFDHCGSGGWEIIRIERGAWMRQGSSVKWTYTIHVERKV